MGKALGVGVVIIPDYARAAFFALLPAAAAGGAMGLPLFVGLAGAAALRPSLLRQVFEKRPVALALLMVFVAWAALSALWSDWHGSTALKVLALLGLGIPFALASATNAHAARLTLATGVAAFIVLAALLGVEAAWDMPLNRALQPDAPNGELNRNPSRGLVVLLALTWPCVASLLARGGGWRVLALVVTVAGAVLSLQFDQLATAIGFAVGLIAFLLAFVAPALVLRAATLTLAAWMLTAPFLTPVLVSSPQLVEAAPLSWAARIGIWRYTCARILEQPWIGHGLDAGRATTDMISIRGLEMRGTPMHPHSASLQVWFELGLVGASLAAAVIAIGGWRIADALKDDKPAAAVAVAAFAMFGLIANVGWSIWQEWWMATLLLTAAMVGAVAARGAKA